MRLRAFPINLTTTTFLRVKDSMIVSEEMRREADKFYALKQAEDPSYRPHCDCKNKPLMIRDRDCFECLVCGKKVKKDMSTIRRATK